MIRYIREDTSGPTDTAKTPQGITASIPGLTNEAQQHLQIPLSYNIEPDPLGDPQETNLTIQQQSNRQTIQRLLEEHYPKAQLPQPDAFGNMMHPSTMEELEYVISKSKRGAASPGLRMPLFKELPNIAKEELLEIINEILQDPTNMPTRGSEAFGGCTC